ncbi:OmpA family protein [Zhongshania sp. BJYM1]|uniref:OmpA family protein n=1 Tax=Zhongshania aquatica TaxID=2965069 RepID=UPI0022B3FA18|nr:OmpA family protein [Marortus sp. BJYM1]
MNICFTRLLLSQLLIVLLASSYCAAATSRPKDSDGDGIADSDDRCPETLAAAVVDSYGCADSDNDGIIDTIDHCPKTPPGENVDQFGCVDSDNDGVKNGDDQCPRTAAGARVMRNGCSAKQSVGLESIWFDYGTADISNEAHEQLAHVAEVLMLKPKYRLALQGHSDSSGSSDVNYRLSRIRANAVKNQLMALGVTSDRIDIEAYGDTMPIADNNTDEGRAKNRRVALRVIRASPSK